MNMTFRTVTHGASGIEQNVNSNGKVSVKKWETGLEDCLVRIAAASVSESYLVERERTLYMAAIFFQRVVSRTPVDEDYLFWNKKKDDLDFHKADDDAVREAWELNSAGTGSGFTAKDFMDAGVSFDKFNSKSDIDRIYRLISDRFAGYEKVSIFIENHHKRFSQLEFGEYLHDGDLKKGSKYYHGVERGYSVQAPYGMLRITQAEFGQMKLSESTEKMIKSYVNRSQRLQKIPSQAKVKRLRSLMKDKTHLSNSDIESVESIR